ncbi:hypothetical protein ABG067_009107, partial [Albugo candida]
MAKKGSKTGVRRASLVTTNTTDADNITIVNHNDSADHSKFSVIRSATMSKDVQHWSELKQ